jgi:hypothetical protein
MSRNTFVTAIVAVALVVPLAGQRVKPAKPQAVAECTMAGEVDSYTSAVTVGRDVASYGPVNQALFIHESLLPPEGSTDFPLVVDALRASGADSEGYYGPYYGQIRVLNDRLDYFFDTAMSGCVADNTAANLCPFRAIVVDGMPVYTGTGKKKVLVGIAFDEGRYLLDYRPCDPALDPDNCYFKLYGCYDDRDCPGVPPGGEGYVYATVTVRFQ